MKQILFCILILALAMTSRAFVDDSRAIDVTANRAGSGILTFTDSSTYNPYDFAGSPIGLLLQLKTPVSVDLRYRTWNLHEKNSPDSLKLRFNGGMAPQLALGVPKTAYFIGSYTPYNLASDSLTLSMQRFGIILAAGAPDGIFGFAISATGFLGTLTPDTAWVRRVMGVEEIGVYFGTRIANMVGFGLHGAAGGFYDTLDRDFVNDTSEDRFFSATIPRIGGDIDVDIPGAAPFASNFSLDVAKNYFMYATKKKGNPSNPFTSNDRFMIAPIVQDSLNWNWQNRITLETDSFFIEPAFLLGYRRTNGTMHDTANGNENPFTIGPANPDSTWRMTSLHWGLGGTLSYHRFLSGTLEYTNGNLALTYGNAYLSALNRSSGRKETIHRVVLSFTARLDKTPGLHFPPWLETSFSMGYLNSLGDRNIDSYRGKDTRFFSDALTTNSQGWRYLPDFGILGYERIQRFSLGLSAAALDRMVGLDTFLAWTGRQNSSYLRGIEFGIDLSYRLASPR